MEPLTLASFPEEILERILSHCVVAQTAQAARPTWHQPASSPSHVRGRTALLLVSRTFLRICTPLFYHTLILTSPVQLHHLLHDALMPNTALASHVRRVVLAGVWAEAGELLKLCHARLESLDVALDAPVLPPSGQGAVRDLDAEEFCDGLKTVKGLKQVAIRKPGSVYLTQARPRYVLFAIAEAMQACDQLEHVELAFRVSDDAGGRTPGPITALTAALATLPRLHTLATVLPTVWNECLLRISVNPALERIVLGDGVHDAQPLTACSSTEGSHGITSTGLFFLQAKKHARLCDLIRAGTSITRTRAQTMGTSAPRGYQAYAQLSQTQHASSSSIGSSSKSQAQGEAEPQTTSSSLAPVPSTRKPRASVSFSPR